MKILLLTIISISLAQNSSFRCLNDQDGQYHQSMEKLISDLSKMKIEPQEFEKKRDILMSQLNTNKEACLVKVQAQQNQGRAPASLEQEVEFEEIEPSDVAE